VIFSINKTSPIPITKEIKIILTNYKTAKIQGEKEIPIEDNANHD
jgi:hypothetical protein